MNKLLIFSSLVVFFIHAGCSPYIYFENTSQEPYVFDVLTPPDVDSDCFSGTVYLDTNFAPHFDAPYNLDIEKEKRYSQAIKDYFIFGMLEQAEFSDFGQIVLSSRNENSSLEITSFKTNHSLEQQYSSGYGIFTEINLGVQLDVKIKPCHTLVEVNKKGRKTFTGDEIFHEDQYLPELSFYQNHAYEAGKALYNRLFPHYVAEERQFYIAGSRYIRKGWRAFSLNHWDKGIEIWKKALESNNPAEKKHAHFNLMYAFEITNQIDKAQNMAAQTYARYQFKEYAKYSKYLKDRQEMNYRLNNYFR